MRTARALTLASALAAAVVPSVIACSSSSDERAGTSSDFALSLGSGTLSMAVGESVTLHASPVAADGTPFAGLYTLAWASSSAAVVAVAADGTVTAQAAGSATITAAATRIDTGAGATASVAVTVGGGSPPPPPPPPPPNGNTLRPDVSGLCLSAAAAIADGTRIMQADCAAAPLRFTETADAVGTELRVAGTSFCVDLPQGSVNNGDLLQLLHCDGSSDQRFQPIAYASARRGFKAVTSGKCFDIKGATAAPGALVQQWSCGDTPEQRFSTDSSGGGGDAGGGGVDSGPSTTASFTSDTSGAYDNPERGFYSWPSGAEWCNGSLAGFRSGTYQGVHQPTTLLFYEWKPSDGAAQLATDLACVRAAHLGLKVILLPSYCSTQNCDEGYDIGQVQGHLAAAKSTLYAYRDVIYTVQMGAIGAWGETHDSPRQLDNATNRPLVRDALLDMTPPEIPLHAHMPAAVMQWYGDTALTEAKAFDGSPQSRMGIANYCFMASANDAYNVPGAVGDIWNGALNISTGITITTTAAQQRDWLAANGEFVPFVAETCMNNGAPDPRLHCYDTKADNTGNTQTGIMNEGKRYHLSAVHREYEIAFPNQWIADGCYGDVNNLIGYRFQFDQIAHPAAVTRGTTAGFSVTMRNYGWARIYSQRQLQVRLVRSGAADIVCGFAPYLRSLPSQATAGSALQAACTIPNGAAAGAYSVHLEIPDVYPGADASYAVRPANANAGAQAWDGTTGRFATGTTVTVN